MQEGISCATRETCARSRFVCFLHVMPFCRKQRIFKSYVLACSPSVNVVQLHNRVEESTEEEEELASEDSSDEAVPQTKRPHDTKGYTRTRRGKVEHVRGYSTGKNRDKPDNN